MWISTTIMLFVDAFATAGLKIRRSALTKSRQCCEMQHRVIRSACRYVDGVDETGVEGIRIMLQRKWSARCRPASPTALALILLDDSHAAFALRHQRPGARRARQAPCPPHARAFTRAHLDLIRRWRAR